MFCGFCVFIFETCITKSKKINVYIYICFFFLHIHRKMKSKKNREKRKSETQNGKQERLPCGRDDTYAFFFKERKIRF